jgi:hypothetical protein
LSRVISGWSIATIQQYTSGTLLTLQAPLAELGAGGLFTGFRKANLTGQDIRTNANRADLDPNNPSVLWINPAAFALPGQYQFGTANRYQNELRNPMRMTNNMSIIKRTPLREQMNLEYRADFFNIFNRTNFGGVVTTIGASNFGRTTGVQSGPRLITMGLRLSF